MISLRRNQARTPNIDLDPGLAGTVRVLTAAYATAVPALVFDPSTAELASPSPVRHWRWKPAVAAVAVALAVAAGFAVPALREGTEAVSAQEILRQARVAVGAPSTSFHQVRSDEHEGTVEVTESWYLDDRHFRVERRTSGGGALSMIDGAIVSGDGIWWYRSADGAVTALRGSRGGPINVAGVAVVGTDIPTTLAMYGGDESCQSASFERDDSVVGRSAFVIRVVPAPQSCARTDSLKTAMEEQASRRMSHTYWIDKRTFLALRSEHREGNRLVARTDTQTFETGIVIAASVFSYEPPEGATVHDVTSIDELCRYTGVGCPRP